MSKLSKRQKFMACGLLMAVMALAFHRRPAPPKPAPLAPDFPEERIPSPIDVIPSEAKLNPGESRLFFARIHAPRENTFRYDAKLFLWKLQEPDAGRLIPRKASQLYFIYTAPKIPGHYHMLVGLKEDPLVQAIVPILVVGEPPSAASPSPKAAARSAAAVTPEPKSIAHQPRLYNNSLKNAVVPRSFHSVPKGAALPQ